MALVSNCSPDLRIYKPNFVPGFPSPEEESSCRSKLRCKIQSFQYKAMKQLHGRRTSSGMRRSDGLFLNCCDVLCFGLLDPVSNIVVNNLICLKECRPRSVSAPEDLERSLEQSLDGLVTFLTRLFPDLAKSQAVRYLDLANADMLVAARIVASDIGLKRFGEYSAVLTEALNMALRCGALAVGLSNPDHLLDGWHKISNQHEEALRLLTLSKGVFRPSIVGKLSRLLRAPPVHTNCEDLFWAWRHAEFRARRPTTGPPRRPTTEPVPVPFQHTSLLNRTLQDAIHGFYLQALARLPAGELRSRFHRSMLKAGHCYGPLDPVSNIIINTIWYDAAFPRTHELAMDVIGTQSLHRMENRSLYGMASFLCTRYHRMNFHEAVRCLLEADANLLLADPNLDPESTLIPLCMVEDKMMSRSADHCNTQAEVPDTGVQEAFLAAATAAHHPNPDAQVKLLTSCKAMLGSALSLLQGYDSLSSKDVQRLALLLSPEAPCYKPLPLLPLTGYPRAEVASAHTRIAKKVKDVLNAYDQMPNGDPTFELHTICGVNDQVSGPVGARHKFLHIHVNFMATRKSPYHDGFSLLFFAEISTNGNRKSFCCPVPLPLPFAASSRCLYCEFMGFRIVHPVGIDFHGRELEFEKVVSGEDCHPYGNEIVRIPIRRFYDNLSIINNRCLLADMVRGRVKEDSLYDDIDGQRRERILTSKSSCAADALFAVPCSSYV